MMSETYDVSHHHTDSSNIPSMLDLKQHPGLLETDHMPALDHSRLVFTDYGNTNTNSDNHASQNQQRMQSPGSTIPRVTGQGADRRRNTLPSSTSPIRDSPLNLCSSGYTGLMLAQSKLDSLKTWGISTYKCTRQALQEKLGKVNRTVDVELEQSIDALRDVQNRYNKILVLTRSLAAHFSNMLSSQIMLSDCFAEIAEREHELKEEFRCNAETQKVVSKNGDKLLAALNFFASNLATLCDKTIEDTILTVKNFETARLEYDAHKNDLEQLQQSQQHQRSADFQRQLHDAEQACHTQKNRYEQMRDDVQVKMKFLHENKVKVMQKQLSLLHNATSSYFTGNQAGLEAVLKQFSIKPKPQNESSWLEG